MPKLSTAEILQKRKPNRKTVPILLESDIKDEIEKLVADIDQEERRTRRAKSLADTDLTEMRAKLLSLYEKAEEHTAYFTFQDIGRRRFVDLVKEHPPSDETKKTFTDLGEDIPEFEPDTFAPALIHATAVDPPISLEEAEEICATWSEADIDSMFLGAYIVCRERTSIPFSEAGIAQNGSTEPSSTIGSVTALDGKDGIETSTK